MKSSPSIWRYEVNVKSTVKILSIFMAFLENMNFIRFGSFKKIYQEPGLKSPE
jgi:hypothetical protein